mgnify:CR=1 FL=1
MLKIAICDDEREARETLGFALEKLMVWFVQLEKTDCL